MIKNQINQTILDENRVVIDIINKDEIREKNNLPNIVLIMAEDLMNCYHIHQNVQNLCLDIKGKAILGNYNIGMY